MSAVEVGGDEILFSVAADGAVQLRATACGQCGSKWFPSRERCAHCADDRLEPFLAGPVATVYASTLVRAGAPDFAVPYSLAYLDVDGVRVLAHVKSAAGLEIAPPSGTAVQLVAGTIGQSLTPTYVAVVASSAGSEKHA